MPRASKGLTRGRRLTRHGTQWPAVLLLLMLAPVRAHPQDSREARAVQRALRLVSGPVAPVVVIDPELAPDAKTLRGLDAFVVREPDGSLRRRIYVNARSPIMRGAIDGSRLSLAVLAAVVHHEMQHLEGRSEAQARAAERDLFTRLMDEGVVARQEGTRFLEQFDRQPPAPPHDAATGGPGAPGPPRTP